MVIIQFINCLILSFYFLIQLFKIILNFYLFLSIINNFLLYHYNFFKRFQIYAIINLIIVFIYLFLLTFNLNLKN